MNKKSLLLLGTALLLLGSSFLIYYVSSKDSEVSKGVVLDVEKEGKLKIGDLLLEIKEAGYFEGRSEVIEDPVVYSEYGNHIVINASITNEGGGETWLESLDVYSADDKILGEGLFVYTDEELPYAVDKDIVEKYKLMENGPDFRYGEKREGLIYLPVKELKGQDVFLEGSVGASVGRLKLNKTDKEIDKSKWGDLKTVFEDNKTEVDLGELKEGSKVDIEEFTLEADGVGVVVKGSNYFEELPEEFLDKVSHLTSITGNESLLMLDVELENKTDTNNHVAGFRLFQGNDLGVDGEYEALKIIGSDNFGEGVVPKTFIDDYGLLEFHGVNADQKDFGKGEVIKGKLVFVGDGLDEDSVYYLQYEGLEEESDKEEFIMY